MKKKAFTISKSNKRTELIENINLSQPVDDGHSTKLFKNTNDKDTHTCKAQYDGLLIRMTGYRLLGLFRIILKHLKYFYFYK